jgi:membrane protease subunit (stomatin/prohibitin family)
MNQQPLTPEQRAALEVQLNEAVAAYHQLTTGQAARVVVDQNGERVEFVAANSAKLASYITSLRMQLAPLGGCGLRALAPAQFIF